MEEILRYKNAIVILAIIALFVVVDYNLITNYAERAGQLEQKEVELENGKQTLREWKSVSAELEKVSYKFLKEDVQLFKKFIEGNAKQHNVGVISVSTSNEEKEFYWEVAMDLSIKCSYANFVEFIKSSETGSIEVKKVSIVAKRDDRDAVISLTLKGYILK